MMPNCQRAMSVTSMGGAPNLHRDEVSYTT